MKNEKFQIYSRDIKFWSIDDHCRIPDLRDRKYGSFSRNSTTKRSSSPPASRGFNPACVAQLSVWVVLVSPRRCRCRPHRIDAIKRSCARLYVACTPRRGFVLPQPGGTSLHSSTFVRRHAVALFPHSSVRSPVFVRSATHFRNEICWIIAGPPSSTALDSRRGIHGIPRSERCACAPLSFGISTTDHVVHPSPSDFLYFLGSCFEILRRTSS